MFYLRGKVSVAETGQPVGIELENAFHGIGPGFPGKSILTPVKP
jgi:hypothetical protein